MPLGSTANHKQIHSMNIKITIYPIIPPSGDICLTVLLWCNSTISVLKLCTKILDWITNFCIRKPLLALGKLLIHHSLAFHEETFGLIKDANQEQVFRLDCRSLDQQESLLHLHFWGSLGQYTFIICMFAIIDPSCQLPGKLMAQRNTLLSRPICWYFVYHSITLVTIVHGILLHWLQSALWRQCKTVHEANHNANIWKYSL